LLRLIARGTPGRRFAADFRFAGEAFLTRMRAFPAPFRLVSSAMLILPDAFCRNGIPAKETC
jgi:hypothetical protein